MNRTEALEAQWKAETKIGESLHFDRCKGGYFSTLDEYALKVHGKSVQSTNLADPSMEYKSHGSSVTSTVVIKNTDSNYISFLAPVEEGKNYRLTARWGSHIDSNARLFWYDDNPVREDTLGVLQSIGGRYWNNLYSPGILTAPAGAKYLFVVVTQQNDVNQATDIRLNEGTEDLGYEPPGVSACVTPDTLIRCCGENLLHDEYFRETQNLVRKYGELRIKGRFSSNLLYGEQKTVLTKGTYFFGYRHNEGYSPKDVVLEYTENGVLKQAPQNTRFTVSDNATIGAIRAEYRIYEVGEDVFYDAWITRGAEESNYIPYKAVNATVPCDLADSDVWYPTTGKVERQDGTSEQYDPQPIYATPGIVTVTQSPTDLAANLSVTMLVHR